MHPGLSWRRTIRRAFSAVLRPRSVFAVNTYVNNPNRATVNGIEL